VILFLYIISIPILPQKQLNLRSDVKLWFVVELTSAGAEADILGVVGWEVGIKLS